MKVYFYHTQDLNQIYKKWNEGRFPGHFLYGATHLPKYGVDIVMHKHKGITNRFKLMLYVTWRVFSCKEHFDAIYATHFNGLEFIIFLRALHLYRKPIILWHHQPVINADNGFREMMSKIFYKGIDHMFMFSEKLIEESLKSGKVSEKAMQVCHWGADLESYDMLKKEFPVDEHVGFISTGKEKRDMPTLIRAFSATGQELSIYVAYNACGDNYLEILNDLRPSSNIHINFIKGLIPNELAQKVWQSKCVVICCQETNYTVGLTTLVEALALGLPIISTRNVTYPFDIEKEGVGILVPYYDSVAWEKAIRFISNNPEEAEEMGKKARALAEKLYNLDNCAREVADVIKGYEKVDQGSGSAKFKSPKSKLKAFLDDDEDSDAKPKPFIPKDDLDVKPIETPVNPRDEVDVDNNIPEPETKSQQTQKNIPWSESEHEGQSIINTEELYARLDNLKDKTVDYCKNVKERLPEKDEVLDKIDDAKNWLLKKINDLTNKDE